MFQIFFGEGEIVTGLNGVDLSRFKSLYRGVSRAHERTFYGVRNWLMRVLQVDPEEYKLRVRSLVNRVQHGFYWELVELQGTKNWRLCTMCYRTWVAFTTSSGNCNNEGATNGCLRGETWT